MGYYINGLHGAMEEVESKLERRRGRAGELHLRGIWLRRNPLIFKKEFENLRRVLNVAK